MKRARYIFFLLVALGTTACTRIGFAIANLPTSFQNGFTVETHSFGPEIWQKLDVYTPEETPPRGVIVFIHGGRWRFGSRKDYQFVGATLAKQGYITVLPDHRKYPAVRFPAFVEDAAKAVAWTYRHIAKKEGQEDALPLHISGHSSGAHIGALLTADESYLAAEGLEANEIITSFAGLAGPYDFTPEAADLIDIFGPPERYPQMQATTFIDGAEPPMLLLYGQDDTAVEAYNHERLARRIREQGGKVDVITYPGMNHAGPVKAFTWIHDSDPLVKDMLSFFERTGSR